MQAARRIGVLVGSSRQGGNGAGIAYWLSTVLKRQLDASGEKVEVITVDPAAPPRPYGPVLDGTKLPAQVTSPSGYSSPAVQEWSKFVSSCHGFAVVSPEYNGGYPGELKNSIDHLYSEWTNKPVLLLTYGGGGGTRAAAQLETVLTAVKLQLLENPVSMKLPREFISGESRVQPNDDNFPQFLSEYEGPVTRAGHQLAQKLFSSPAKA